MTTQEIVDGLEREIALNNTTAAFLTNSESAQAICADKNAILSAAAALIRANMRTWTREVPTVAGPWWFRRRPGAAPELFTIRTVDGRLGDFPPGGEWCPCPPPE